jgi:Recombinase
MPRRTPARRTLLLSIEQLKGAGAASLRQIAAGLNAKGIKTARAGVWSAVQVQRVIRRQCDQWLQGEQSHALVVERSYSKSIRVWG